MRVGDSLPSVSYNTYEKLFPIRLLLNHTAMRDLSKTLLEI